MQSNVTARTSLATDYANKYLLSMLTTDYANKYPLAMLRTKYDDE